MGESTTLTANGVSQSIEHQLLLAPVSAKVRGGECLAVLGPNGAGKTTLLRILSGLVTPTTGDVRLDDDSLDERSRLARRTIAALVGTPAFYPDMTVREQLHLICATWRVSPDLSDTLVSDILARFELATLESRFIHELSSGQTQMFYLASVFVRPFEVLILDEPEQRLDAHRQGLVVDAIIDAKRRGVAIVVASHDHKLVAAVADRRLVLGAA